MEPRHIWHICFVNRSSKSSNWSITQHPAWTSHMTVIHQECLSRAAGSCMNLTCVTSCPGDRDVTAMTADVSHVALQHSASVSWQTSPGRGSCQKNMSVTGRPSEPYNESPSHYSPASFTGTHGSHRNDHKHRNLMMWEWLTTENLHLTPDEAQIPM